LALWHLANIMSSLGHLARMFSTGTLFSLLSNVSFLNSDPGLSYVNNIQIDLVWELLDRLATLEGISGIYLELGERREIRQVEKI
jgi:hypothetical protein